MRILLLGFGKIAYMPYMNFYLEQLKNRSDCNIELIYWDRDGKQDAEVPELITKTYKFEAHLEEHLSLKHKMKYFIKYREFTLKILKKNKYDKIIVLHTTPGLTILDYLIRKYKGKYVLDFRDVSYEYFTPYRKLVEILSKRSAITFVSSNAFRKFLPKSKNIYTIHNYLEDSLNHQNLRIKEDSLTDRIRISYWGLVRQVEINKKLIDKLGNDDRFELHYYGRMQRDGREMEKYVYDKEYSNIFFHGSYMPEERYKFAMQTDIIHNIYECDYTTGNAMGNKYYDGIIFRLPQICSIGSHMGNEIKEKEVGLTVSVDDKNLANQLWDYYKGIDWKCFDENCAKALTHVLEEQEKAKHQFGDFLAL